MAHPIDCSMLSGEVAEPLVAHPTDCSIRGEVAQPLVAHPTDCSIRLFSSH